MTATLIPRSRAKAWRPKPAIGQKAVEARVGSLPGGRQTLVVGDTDGKEPSLLFEVRA
jgi:hypothetical protein